MTSRALGGLLLEAFCAASAVRCAETWTPVNSESEKSAIPLLGGIAPLVLTRHWPPPTYNLTYPQSFHMLSAMTTTLSIVIVALATALIAALFFAVRVVSRSFDRVQTAPEPVPSTWAHEHITKLEVDVANLTVAVSEGIAGFKRHENRIQKTVTSARRLVREAGLEHAGIEAEYDELRPVDAEAEPTLPPMPEEVATTRTIRIPGGHLEIGAA